MGVVTLPKAREWENLWIPGTLGTRMILDFVMDIFLS